MKKFWLVVWVATDGKVSVVAEPKGYPTKDEAENEMKRRAADKNAENQYIVVEAISAAKRPVPNIELVPLT